jgi:hypothetical protein
MCEAVVVILLSIRRSLAPNFKQSLFVLRLRSFSAQCAESCALPNNAVSIKSSYAAIECSSTWRHALLPHRPNPIADEWAPPVIPTKLPNYYSVHGRRLSRSHNKRLRQAERHSNETSSPVCKIILANSNCEGELLHKVALPA